MSDESIELYIAKLKKKDHLNFYMMPEDESEEPVAVQVKTDSYAKILSL